MADIQSNINVNVDTSGAISAIRNLQREISAVQKDLLNGSATDVANATKQQQTLINNINATRKFSAEVQNIKTTTESFTTALEKNKLSLGQYFKYSIAATRSFGGAFKTEMNVIDKVARERVKDLQTQYIKLGRDANGAMKAIAVRPLTLDLENLATKTAIAAQKQQILNQLLMQGSTNLLNFGKNTQWAGRQLMVGFTIPLVMAGTAAAKAYMQIEQASVNIRRVYGDLSTSVQETNQMVDSIKNLATEYTKYGLAVADTMEMAAKAAAMGKTGADLLAQVGNASRLAALGGVDQNTALQTTISLTNAFGLSAEQLAGKVDFLNAVENQTVLSIEDMTTALPKAAPIVKQLGGNMEDLAFFMTAMKEGGINASEGANAIKSGLASLINPTKKASEFLAGFGVNVKGIVEQDKGNLRKTVVDFASALDKIDPLNRARAIEMMFGKFQFARISTLLKNVTDQGSQATKTAGIASLSAIQLAALSRKELDKISSSPMYQFQKAMADMQKSLAPVGEAFLKAVTPIIKFVTNILDGFNGMSDQFKNFAVVGAAVIGGLAPVLLMVVGLVANGAANIIKLFAGIKAFFNKTATASQTLGETTDYLTTEQIKAEAVAASLEQTHSRLTQVFTSETAAVEMLTAAYEQYLLRSSSGMGAGAVGKPAKGYATGGIVRGPGTATSDSVPANLSNGEVVLSVETVKKNPALIGALLSGKKVNVPGYATSGVAGDKYYGKQMNIPSGSELGHFSQVPLMSGRELIQNAKDQGATKAEIAKIEAMVEKSSRGLDTLFKVFDDRVEKVSRELNQLVGDPGSGKTAPKAVVERDLVTRGRDARAPIIGKMMAAGATPEQALESADKITAEVKATLDKLGKEVELTAEDINKITQDAYEKVAATDDRVKAAYQEQKAVKTYKDPTTDRGERGQRESFQGGMASNKFRADLRKQAKELGTDYSTQAAFKTTPGIDAAVGTSKEHVQAAYNQLPDAAKERVAKFAINKDDKGFAKQLEKEAKAAGVTIIKTATDSVIEGEKEEAAKSANKVKTESKASVKKFVDGSKLDSVSSKLSGIGSSPELSGNTPVSYSQSAINSASKTRRGPSPFIEKIKSSVAAAPSNLANEGRMLSNEAKSIFEQLKDIFKIGGQKAVAAVETGLIDDSQQLVVAGQKMGFDYIEALKGGNGAIAAVITSGNEKIIAAALEEYNAGGYKIAGAISLGLDKGIAAEISSGLMAAKGKQIADAISDGTYMAGSKQKKVPYGQEGPLLPGQTMAKMPIGERLAQAKVGLSEKYASAKEKYAAGKAKGAAFLDEKVLNKTSGSLAKIGGAATAAVFALSMIPGPIGSFMQSLLPFISIASMLPPLFSALGISTVALTGEMVMAALPVVAALALLAGGIALAVILNNQANEAKQRELDQINASTRAHEHANKALAEFGKLSGVTPGKDRLAVAKTAISAGVSTKQASDVNVLMDSAEFKDPKSAISSMIGDIKGMTDVAAKDFLSTYANTLKGAGFDDKTIDAILTAIKIKANKTDLKLDFASVDINSKKGRGQVTKGLQDALAGVSGKSVTEEAAQKKNVSNPFVATDTNGNDVYLSDIYKAKKRNEGILKTAPKGSREYDAAKEAIAGNNALIATGKKYVKESTDKINSDPRYAKVNNDIKTGANAVVDTVNSAIGQFGTKNMSKKNFDATMKAVQDGLSKSSAKGAVMAAALKKLGPEVSGTGAKIAGLSAKALKGAKSFDKTKTQLDLFAIAAANPTLGKKLVEDIGKIDVTAAGAAVQIQNLIKAAKGQALGSSAGVTNVDLKDQAGGDTSGGGTDPKQLLADTKASVAANAMNLSMIKKGYNSEFIASITGADAATQKYYLTTLKNGTKVLNEHGRALLAAFNTKTISDFLIAQKGIISGAASELSARKQLKAAGLDQESVKAMSARSDVQAALAAANATVGVKARAKAIKEVIDSLKAEKTATDSLASAQDKFQKTYDTGTKYLDVQANIVNRDFEKSTAGLTATILKANQDIQDLQTGKGAATGLNQYNDGLSKLKFREDEINKKYDERAKALAKVAIINQRISDQQKGQLSLAQALSSGDIAAAAQAAQDMNAQNATSAVNDQKTALDEAKQKELDNLTVSVNGKLMTRKEIEEASAVIQEKILDIQIKQLEPAQTAYDLAARARDASLKSISDQKAQWDDWKLSIDAATTSLAQYNAAIAAAGPQAIAAANETGNVTPVPVYNSQGFTTSGDVQLYGSFMNTVGYNNAQAPVSRSMGGIVPGYFAAGGYAKGTDTVPAMLTPGEFVVKKYAVDNFGVDNLKAINSGATVGGNSNTSVGVSNTNYDGSVYNYSVNVNVRSDANPDQIANAVMNKIGEVNSRRIRGNRL